MPGVPLAEQREDVLCGSTAGEKELERALGEGSTEAYGGELRAWRDALERRLTEVFDAAVRVAARVSPEEAKSHPAAALLFMQLRGRLSVEALRRHAPGPKKLAQLSAALGLSPLAVPLPASK